MQIFRPLEDSCSLRRPLSRFQTQLYLSKVSLRHQKQHYPDVLVFCCYTKQAIKTRLRTALIKSASAFLGFIERIFTVNKTFSKEVYIIRKLNEQQDEIREKFSRRTLTWTQRKTKKRQGWLREFKKDVTGQSTRN